MTSERIAAKRWKVEAALLQLRHEQTAHFVWQQSSRQVRLEAAAATAHSARIETGYDAGTRRLGDRMRGHLDGSVDRAIAIDRTAKAQHAAESSGDQGFVQRQIIERGDRTIHEIRSLLAQARRIERPIGQHRIGRLDDQLVQRVVGANDTALAAQPDPRVRLAARRIAVARFDFDHLGAEVRQHHRSEPTDGTRRDIDYAQIL